MRIPLRRAERAAGRREVAVAARRPASSAALVACLTVAGLCGLPAARAHDSAVDPLPEAPGLRLGAAGLVSALAADPVPYPAASYPGWLGSGQTPASRRGVGLEHAALDLGLRLSPLVGATLALGQHGADRAHVEAARVEFDLPAAQLAGGLPGELRVSAGRDRVPLGAPVGQAGHFDRFALVPLAKRLMLNDDWIDDGISLGWRADEQAGALQGADLGVWRARKFPGASQGRGAPVAHLQGEVGDLQLHAYAAWLAPRGRGTPVARLSSGHSHEVPDCSRSLVGLSCFDGRSTLGGLSLSWAPHGQALQLQGSWLSQLERGQLYGSNGDVSYRGHHMGGWADVNYRLAPRWQAALRAEQISTEHRLSGPGASLLSQDAGLSANQAVRRQALSVGYTARRGLQFWAEAGREQSGLGPQRWVGLRLACSSDALWSVAW
jgi:hypothetical protein